jgi:hypothetical protein
MGNKFTVHSSKLKVLGEERRRVHTECTEKEHRGHGEFGAKA